MEFNFIEHFKQPDAKRYLFGATEEAAQLVDSLNKCGLDIVAVVDSFYPDLFFAGVPCIKVDALPCDALVLSCVTNSRPIDVAKFLDGHNIKQCDFFTFKRDSKIACPDIDFWQGAVTHYEQAQSDYHQVSMLLEDELSKQTFDAVTQFRVNCDLDYMKPFAFDITNMYFESFIFPMSNKPIFFDLGAFDGSDSQRFLDYESEGTCYLFEPIPEQVERLNKRFERDDRVNVLPYAVGKSDETVNFSLSGTSSKVVSNENTDCVAVEQVSLDRFIKTQSLIPDFVKMDVEGAEMDVLNGMKEFIKSNKPKLAVSVYHKVEHIIDVPLLLKALNPDYRFYLRHYTQGYSETVLFAV